VRHRSGYFYYSLLVTAIIIVHLITNINYCCFNMRNSAKALHKAKGVYAKR
jgi:hypothetical protein